MRQLTNEAEVSGSYDGVDVYDTTELSVELSAITIKKEADKKIWVNGNLTYTITVNNIDESTPGIPATGVVVTDFIDPKIAKLVDGTVQINGTPAVSPTQYTYDPITGLLTVMLEDMPAGSKHIITFQVEFV